MAWARKRPNGRYQGIATHPNGSKRTQTFPLKRQAIAWAEEQEALWRRDRNHDPRAGDMHVADWVTKWRAARVVERNTAAKNESHLRNHILPKWGTWPLNSIDRLDVGAWVKEMEKAGVGPATIEASVRLLSSVLHGAMEVGRIPSNPAARQRVPKPPTSAPRYFSRGDAAQLLAAIPEPQWRTACDLDLHVGLRIGELLGLQAGAVDWSRAELHVRGVITRHGWRGYAKSKRSHRAVPIPRRLLDDLAPYVLGKATGDPVFPAPRGGFMSDVNFRNRVWDPAIARTDLSRETPHTMRHTAASWLVMAGVDLYRVQALLGHESFATTQRYAHLAPDASDAIRAAWDSGVTL